MSKSYFLLKHELQNARKGKIYTQILGRSISLTLIKIAMNFDLVASLVASLNFRREWTAHNDAR